MGQTVSQPVLAAPAPSLAAGYAGFVRRRFILMGVLAQPPREAFLRSLSVRNFLRRGSPWG